MAASPQTLSPRSTLMRPRVMYISWLNFVHRWIVPLMSPKVMFSLSWVGGSTARNHTGFPSPLRLRPSAAPHPPRISLLHTI